MPEDVHSIVVAMLFFFRRTQPPRGMETALIKDGQKVLESYMQHYIFRYFGILMSIESTIFWLTHIDAINWLQSSIAKQKTRWSNQITVTNLFSKLFQFMDSFFFWKDFRWIQAWIKVSLSMFPGLWCSAGSPREAAGTVGYRNRLHLTWINSKHPKNFFVCLQPPNGSKNFVIWKICGALHATMTAVRWVSVLTLLLCAQCSRIGAVREQRVDVPRAARKPKR